MRIPKKIYNSPYLTPDERFHLLLKSSGRKDALEFERLLQTTPQKTYDARDRKVIDKLESAERIATCFVIMALEYSRYIGAIYLEGFRTNTDVHEYALDEIKHYKSLKITIDTFCEKVGILPTDLLSLHPSGIKEYCYIADFPPIGDKETGVDEEFFEALSSTLN